MSAMPKHENSVLDSRPRGLSCRQEEQSTGFEGCTMRLRTRRIGSSVGLGLLTIAFGLSVGQGKAAASGDNLDRPSNDNCADAYEIADGATTFETAGMTTDGPPHPSCFCCGDPQINQDIWYNYTATQTGT